MLSIKQTKALIAWMNITMMDQPDSIRELNPIREEFVKDLDRHLRAVHLSRGRNAKKHQTRRTQRGPI